MKKKLYNNVDSTENRLNLKKDVRTRPELSEDQVMLVESEYTLTR